MCITDPVKSSIDGFFEIPGFSRYAISRDGRIVNKNTKQILKGYVSVRGYHKYTLIGDDDNKITTGRHRLLCIVFKNPGTDYSKLYVNHINNIPGDDRLENLEWATPKQNSQHAANQGRMDYKEIRIQVKDIDTGDIEEFKTRMDCARKYHMTRDQLNYRLMHSATRVYPERKQYRIHVKNDPWPDPDDVDLEMLTNGTTKKVLCYNAIAKAEYRFDSIGDMANFLGVKQSTVSVWLKQNDLRVQRYGWIVKFCGDPRPWRPDLMSRKDVYEDYKEHNNQSGVVQVVDERSERTYYYWTARDAAKALGLNVTALDYRLKTCGKVVFSDGCRYGYFPYGHEKE